jgi:hypothetical protein
MGGDLVGLRIVTVTVVDVHGDQRRATLVEDPPGQAALLVRGSS